MPIRFVTSNEGKAEEAREYLDDVERVDFDYTEIQGDLEAVAAAGARDWTNVRVRATRDPRAVLLRRQTSGSHEINPCVHTPG